MHCHFNGTLLISVLPPILVTEIVLGIVGNGFALWIFCFHLRPWKSSTVLLFNLAVADFFLIVVLPLRASYYISGIEWMFGVALCNILLFMVSMNRSGSTIFLMAIAADRYMRVVHPHHPVNYWSISKATCGALVLWLVTISMTAHVLHLKHSNTTYCESFVIESEPQSNLNWYKFAFLLSFVIPLLAILYCTVHIIIYLRSRKLASHAATTKALCVLTVVVLLFIICFLPSNIMQVVIWIKIYELANTLPPSEVCPALEDLTNSFYMTLSLTYLNSVLDPVVYYFSCPAFKRIFWEVLRLPQGDSAEGTKKETREKKLPSPGKL